MKVVRQKLLSTGVDATSRYDITIVGAGPAGSVLALLAARARHRVLLVEKSQFDKPRFGETAPPELRQALTCVGLERLAQAPFCREAPEVLSVWGSNEPRSRHHIYSPYGTALHLDRRAFDEALAFAARDAGADLRLSCAAHFALQPRGGYIVQLSTGDRIRTNAAIIATGRAGGNLGLPFVREYLDNNIAVAARLSSPGTGLEPRTIIEAVPGGWFYLAALPGNEIIVVFVTLATLVPSDRRVRLRWWLQALARTIAVRKALNRCHLPESLCVVDARASYARASAGERWLAIGDARIAPDPLSGQGILWAFDDAIWVMDLLRRMEWCDLAREMRARNLRDVDAYRVERSAVYSSEQRFKEDVYWMGSGPALPVAPLRKNSAASTQQPW